MSEAEAVLPFEYLHRYSYAAELLRGKRVLDLACREGYGTRILAEIAESVLGMDPDEAVVRDAIQKHKRDNLAFAAGSVLSLPGSGHDGFDAVVCFDAIENAMDPSRVIVEIKRVLAPGGLLIISVPHAGASNDSLPEKAFAPEEFHRFVQSHFVNLEKVVQRVHGASVIEHVDRNDHNPPDNCGEAQYLIAVASDGTIPDLERSTLPQPALSLLRDKDKVIRELLDMKAYLNETTQRQEKQLADHKRTNASLEEAFAWHTSRIDSLNKARGYLDHEIDELRQSMASDKKALDWRAAQVQDLEEAIADKDKALTWRASQIQEMEHAIAAKDVALEKLEALRIKTENRLNDLSRKLAQATEELEMIHTSAGWKFLLRVRSIRMRLLPDGTMRYRLCKRIAKMVSGG